MNTNEKQNDVIRKLFDYATGYNYDGQIVKRTIYTDKYEAKNIERLFCSSENSSSPSVLSESDKNLLSLLANIDVFTLAIAEQLKVLYCSKITGYVISQDMEAAVKRLMSHGLLCCTELISPVIREQKPKRYYRLSSFGKACVNYWDREIKDVGLKEVGNPDVILSHCAAAYVTLALVAKDFEFLPEKNVSCGPPIGVDHFSSVMYNKKGENGTKLLIQPLYFTHRTKKETKAQYEMRVSRICEKVLTAVNNARLERRFGTTKIICVANNFEDIQTFIRELYFLCEQNNGSSFDDVLDCVFFTSPSVINQYKTIDKSCFSYTSYDNINETGKMTNAPFMRWISDNTIQ
ncbi:MAG: hypothetical protein K6G88_11075 [Lachnospiraceae bacterium]|nr:hypothetical protein [Lachnospiraceae bacterium]